MDIRKWFKTTVSPSTSINDSADPIQQDNDNSPANICDSVVGGGGGVAANIAASQASTCSSISTTFGPDLPTLQGPPEDLGDEKPNQVKLDKKFRSATAYTNVDSVFITKGYCNWKHANESNKGFHKHATSKEHLTCVAAWRERGKRTETDTEISKLINTEQLSRNRYYMSAIIDTLRKDQQLVKVVKTIPRNATYTSHEIQNELLEAMSSVITDAIVRDIGSQWFTIKVDGTRDSTGCENISIVIRFISEDSCKVTERLLTMATAEAGDAGTLTDTILQELQKAGLSSAKILSQCYDGASLMSGKHGGVQKLLQDRLGREIPYIHCFNHQLHLVVVHALSAEEAIGDFFKVCGMLYNFLRKPTVSTHYKGDTLKRLLDQRWTGHLATVSVILKNLEDIIAVLSKTSSSRAFGSEVRVLATGLLHQIKERSFVFIGHSVHKILLLLDSPNKQLQAKEMDLLNAVKLVHSAIDCVRDLRCDDAFTELWSTATNNNEPIEPSKRRRVMNRNLEEYVLEESVGQNDTNNDDKSELKRLFFSAIDAVLGEMDVRFSERNGKLISALEALDPENKSFLDVKKLKHIMDLAGMEIVESEFCVARRFLQSQMEDDSEEKWTVQRLLSKHYKTLKAMPTALTALQLALVFGASTATCENSFSTLKNVFSEHRRSMLHTRKARLVQLAFEKDLTKKCCGEWKDAVLRKFQSAHKRRLQLF
ncbi:unnamed protein product [Leuciscus chuanchicus]